LKKFLIIALLFFGFGFSNVYLAQTGGKKREHRNHKRGGSFKRHKSAGHADEFARGGGRKSMFSRLFKKSRPTWSPKGRTTDRSRYADNSKLFSRFRTKGKQFNEMVLSKRNADRARKRVRGNKTFSRKKY
jgi:hypothetical protein